MKLYLDNFDNNSDSGPNGFAKKLLNNLVTKNQIKISDYNNCDLSFCLIQSTLKKEKPTVLRLDGIYFNSSQDFESLNRPIRQTYEKSDAVVFQTLFNKNLIEHWFGKHQNYHVIRNGTNFDVISSIPKITSVVLDAFSEVWSCAASWRPHKRLDENIRYFLEFAPQDACLVVMGKGAEQWLVEHPRILYAGHVTWDQQISIYKRSSTFLHLAWFDHCPNVVVDARASGCKIVCSSTGGTKEIAGLDATIINEDDWDFRPIRLYEPPVMNFSNIRQNEFNIDIGIEKVTNFYLDAFKSVLK